MQVYVEPGKYVVAVSGGVDSMALLDMLAQRPDLELVVAHFEHGIREDSLADLRLVESAAHTYGLPFIHEHGNLGPGASEASARDVRYAFLRRVQAAQKARALITAHHQDDVVETAILNGLRGTGSRGLSSLQSHDVVVRPLLHLPKQYLYAYARARKLTWREDSTNQDVRYRRNYIRQVIMPRLTPEQRAQLVAQIATAADLNGEIQQLVATMLAQQNSPDVLDRRWFIQLPHRVATEVMAEWLRAHRLSFDRPTVERLVVFVKTSHPGKRADITGRHVLHSDAAVVTLTVR